MSADSTELRELTELITELERQLREARSCAEILACVRGYDAGAVFEARKRVDAWLQDLATADTLPGF
ncbi:MAG: hypothetical protein AAFU79_03515 [Myxococcota bacterium]